MEFRSLLNLFESYEQLDEDLGALANLHAGDLINVFKQAGSTPQINKFARGPWQGSIGQESGQVDIGKITSWKDLRKAIGRNNEKKIAGAIFYVDGVAFAALNLDRDADDAMYAPSRPAILAFDPSKLPKTPPAPIPDTRGWSERDRNRIPDATAREKKGWEDKLQKWTGRQIQIRELDKYIDNIIGQLPEHEFTCVALTADLPGTEKSRARNQAKVTNDEIKGRHDDLDNYSGEKHKSLYKALDKFKASKNFNSFAMPEELLEFISDTNNYGEAFVYKDKQYTFSLDKYHAGEVRISKESIIKNKPYSFDATFRETAPGSYGYVTVTYQVAAGQVAPTSVR